METENSPSEIDSLDWQINIQAIKRQANEDGYEKLLQENIEQLLRDLAES